MDEIADMPTGPEMDAAVAERVMGWKVYQSPFTATELRSQTWGYVCILDDGTVMLDYATSRRRTWAPSIDIAAAMEVVEKMNHYPEAIHDAFLQHLARNNPNYEPWKVIGWVLSLSNKPEWICRAALKSLNSIEGE